MRYLHSIIHFVTKQPLELLFVSIFILAGLGFTFLMPPGQNPDERFHFMRAYQLAHFSLHADTHFYYGQKQIGGEIPQTISQFFFESSSQTTHPITNKTKQLPSSSSAKTSSFENFPNTAVYSPLVYLPDIIAIWLGQLLHISVAATVYIARLFTLLTVAALFFIAIRLIPTGKWLVFVIGLLPSTVNLSAAISADSLTIGISVLFVGFVLWLAHTRQPATASFIVLGALAVGLALVKPAYIPLLLLLGLLPLLNQEFRTKKNLLILGGIALGSLLIYFGWLASVSYVDINFNASAQPAVQKQYILSHPITYAAILASSLLSNKASSSPFEVFRTTDWLVPDIFVIVLIICLVLALYVRDQREIAPIKLGQAITPSTRLLFVFSALVSVVLVASSLYIYYTNPKTPIIQGIQQRYFIPVVLPLLLAFSGLHFSRQKHIKGFIGIACCMVLVVSLLATYYQYRLPGLA